MRQFLIIISLFFSHFAYCQDRMTVEEMKQNQPFISPQTVIRKAPLTGVNPNLTIKRMALDSIKAYILSDKYRITAKGLLPPMAFDINDSTTVLEYDTGLIHESTGKHVWEHAVFGYFNSSKDVINSQIDKLIDVNGWSATTYVYTNARQTLKDFTACRGCAIEYTHDPILGRKTLKVNRFSWDRNNMILDRYYVKYRFIKI